MDFSFEEAELFNNYFEGIKEIPDKEEVIRRLKNARDNTKDPELVSIAESTVSKLRNVDDCTFKKIFESLPLDPYTKY